MNYWFSTISLQSRAIHANMNLMLDFFLFQLPDKVLSHRDGNVKSLLCENEAFEPFGQHNRNNKD